MAGKWGDTRLLWNKESLIKKQQGESTRGPFRKSATDEKQVSNCHFASFSSALFKIIIKCISACSENL